MCLWRSVTDPKQKFSSTSKHSFSLCWISFPVPALFLNSSLWYFPRFYTLLVLATALFGQPPFRNVIVNGLVLARQVHFWVMTRFSVPWPSFVKRGIQECPHSVPTISSLLFMFFCTFHPTPVLCTYPSFAFCLPPTPVCLKNQGWVESSA